VRVRQANLFFLMFSLCISLCIHSKRKQLKFVSSKPFASDVGHSQVQLQPDSKSARLLEETDEKESILLFIHDFMLVVGHILLILVAVAPMILLPVLSETSSGQSSSRAVPYQLSASDLYVWDSLTYNKIVHLRMSRTNVAIVFVGVVFFSIQMVELILYYTFQPFQLKFHHYSRATPLRIFFQKLVFISFGVCLHVWSGYIALTLIWLILGAILNPYKYLPYAAAAAVMITFSSIQSTSASNKFSKKVGVVKNAAIDRFSEEALKMLPLLNRDGEISMGKQNEKNRIETRALELVESDSYLRKVLHRCKGVDLINALGLAMGSKKCMLTASESLGMNVNILSCIVSVARFDHRGVLNAIKILGAKSTFGETVNADLLTRVYRLAQHQNEESLRLAVKDILAHSVDLNKISPHQLSSIIAMGRGQIDRLVDVVKENADVIGQANNHGNHGSVLRTDARDKKLFTVGEGADDGAETTGDKKTVDDGAEKEETSAEDGTTKIEPLKMTKKAEIVDKKQRKLQKLKDKKKAKKLGISYEDYVKQKEDKEQSEEAGETKVEDVGEGAAEGAEKSVGDGAEKEETIVATTVRSERTRTRIGVVAAFLEIIRNDGSTFQELDFMRDWKELLNEVTDLDEDVQNGVGFLRIGRVREPSALKLLSDDHFNITAARDDIDCRSAPTKTLGKNLASLLIGIARENHDECRIYGPGSEVFSTTVREASGIIMIPAQLQGLIAVARGCLIDIVALSQMVGLETKVSGL